MNLARDAVELLTAMVRIDSANPQLDPNGPGESELAAFIAAAGIPTVLYGPAGDGAHAGTEWVSLASTRTCASVLSAVAREFCA